MQSTQTNKISVTMLYTYMDVNEFYFLLYDIAYFNACLFLNVINIPPDDDYFERRKFMGEILLLFKNITH